MPPPNEVPIMTLDAETYKDLVHETDREFSRRLGAAFAAHPPTQWQKDVDELQIWYRQTLRSLYRSYIYGKTQSAKKGEQPQ